MRLAVHIQILLSMALGLCLGIIASFVGAGDFVLDWIKPFGDIFVRMLKLIAVPIVLISLLDGITNLKDLSGLSRMGFKTLGLYISTTVLAICLGLLVVNTIAPGGYLSEEKQQVLREQYLGSVSDKLVAGEEVQDNAPLQPLLNMVPDNFLEAASSNSNMLQVIFFAMLFGIAMASLPSKQVAPVKQVLSTLNSIVLQVVAIIMRLAPFGVFALLMGLMVEMASDAESLWSLLAAMTAYVASVLLALGLLLFVVYPLAVQLFTGKRYLDFMRGILPAQLLAFSTSSSAATLPVTLRCVEKNLGVREEVSSFVLPIGATVNMDGTSIHQAVSAVFIAQVFGHDLTLSDQLVIILTATLSSIGAAAVPGGGIVMLVVVLGAIGISPEGLALIIALDRPLDMCRTAVNVTGDATVALLVNKDSRNTPSLSSTETPP